MAQRPCVKLSIFKIVQRAGGVAVGLALAFDRAVQNAKLKAVMVLVAPEQAGQVAAFLDLGVADAVHHSHDLAVFFNRVAFGIRPENSDVVRPLHSRQS